MPAGSTPNTASEASFVYRNIIIMKSSTNLKGGGDIYAFSFFGLTTDAQRKATILQLIV